MEMLHELISNMSMAERSYFKRYASKLTDGSATNYVQLFDSIASQNSYDEAALRKKFAGEKFVKQFSVAKSYLYEAIIKALKNYYEKSNVLSQVKHLQLELAILMDKGIYDQAAKVISKGRTLSEEFELFADLNEFLSKETYLLMNHYRHEEDSRTVDKVIEEQQRLALKISNSLDFEKQYQMQHRLITGNYHLRDQIHKDELKSVFDHALFRKKEHAQSDYALYLFHYVRTMHFSVFDERKQFMKEATLLVAHCASSPRFSEFDLRSYMNALNLLLEASYFNQNFEQMNIALQTLKKLPVNSERDKTAQFIYYSRFSLVYYDRLGDRKAKMKEIDDAWHTIRKMERKIPFHIRISSLVTYSSALMEMGEYSKALDWIGLFQQKKKEEEARTDVQSILLMLQLIAHYELGNTLLVKNIVPNIARFIRKAGQQGAFEKIALRFFGKITSAKEFSPKEFSDTLAELQSLKDGDIMNRNRTLHDIFSMFIQSKKNGKKYHEMIA